MVDDYYKCYYNFYGNHAENKLRSKSFSCENVLLSQTCWYESYTTINSSLIIDFVNVGVGYLGSWGLGLGDDFEIYIYNECKS